MEEKVSGCGSDHSVDVISVIIAGFDALKNIHLILCIY